jgi:hypothetical protein
MRTAGFEILHENLTKECRESYISCGDTHVGSASLPRTELGILEREARFGYSGMPRFRRVN